MRLSPRARRALRKRNALNAAAMARAAHADMRDDLVTIQLVRINVKAIGTAMPVGNPPMVQNRLFDAQEKRATQRANGGLTKGIVEHFPSADPERNAMPSYLSKRERRKPFSEDGY